MPTLAEELLRNIKRAVPSVVLLSAGFVVLSWFLPVAPTVMGGLLTIALYAYALFRTALFDIPLTVRPLAGTSGNPRPYGSLARFLALCAIFVVVVSGPALYSTLRNEPRADLFAWAFNLRLLVSAPPLAWVTLSLFGTLLPATAAGAQLSRRSLFAAQRRTSRLTALQLLLAPFVILLPLVFAASIFDGSGGLDPNPTAELVMTFLINALALMTLVVTVVILTRAYRIGWLQEPAPTR